MPGANLVKWEFLGDGCEELAHVLSRLRRGLEEEQACLTRVGLGVCDRHCPLVGLLRHQVEFVSGKGDDDILICLSLQLLDPRLGLVQ